MTKLKSHSLDLGYPVYGAKFVNNNTFIVAGGGGEGNNGIPNKITALLVQPDNLKKPIKRYRELVLNDSEDCPMSLDVNNNVILIGINENSNSIKKGINKHLRKFKYHNEHLKFIESCQIHPSNNSTHYQKLTSLSKDGTLGVIAISDNPSSLYIVDTSDNLEERFKIFTAGEVKDISISPDGKMMCYITSSHFEAISTITGRTVFKTEVNFAMSKIAFYDNNTVIIAGVNKSGLVLGDFSVTKSAVTKITVVAKNMKGITSMDVNSTSGIVSLAGSDCSVLLVRFSDFKLLKKVEKVHGFAITKITSSSDGKYIVSTSAANTVNLLIIPDKFSTAKSWMTSIFQMLLSVVIVGLLAVLIQFLYVNGYIGKFKSQLVEYYNQKRKPTDSSSYFTVQPIAGSSEVDTNGPPSTTDYFPMGETIGNDHVTIEAFTESWDAAVSTEVPESVYSAVVEEEAEQGVDEEIEPVAEKEERKEVEPDVVVEQEEEVDPVIEEDPVIEDPVIENPAIEEETAVEEPAVEDEPANEEEHVVDEGPVVEDEAGVETSEAYVEPVTESKTETTSVKVSTILETSIETLFETVLETAVKTLVKTSVSTSTTTAIETSIETLVETSVQYETSIVYEKVTITEKIAEPEATAEVEAGKVEEEEAVVAEQSEEEEKEVEVETATTSDIEVEEEIPVAPATEDVVGKVMDEEIINENIETDVPDVAADTKSEEVPVNVEQADELSHDEL